MKKIKYAILGKGKTGKYLLDLIENDSYTLFDSQNSPTLDSLQGHDVLISFLPGDIFLEYLPVFKASKIPLIVGSTGFNWPPHTDTELKKLNLRWIWSHNFALGMNLVKVLIEKLSTAENLFPQVEYKIVETHHTGKMDSPSGTAKSWDNWLSKKSKNKDSSTKIESIRHGDIVGIHKLEVDTPFEKITLIHEAKDRKIFAEGAIWAAKKILSDTDIPFGLNSFSDIALKELI